MGLRTEVRKFFKINKPMRPEFQTDGLGVNSRNLKSLEDPKFLAAWKMGVNANKSGGGGKVPDIRWRAHTAVWAARHGLTLEGDFVECGVFLGLLSVTICNTLDFANVDKTFYLFDTYEGLPEEGVEPLELDNIRHHNRLYFDCYEQAKSNFAPFPNAQLVKGILPASLSKAPLDRIAYLSIDLNNAPAEKAVIEELWDRLTPSAIVVLDDYGFTGFSEQHDMWDAFAASNNTSIYTSPTGQGILVKPS